MMDAAEILAFLGTPPARLTAPARNIAPARLTAPARPSLRNLNRLIAAYTQTVPWESVFRINKRLTTPDTARCPRWPPEFWRDAIQFGGGGTCYETNYAFFGLLQQLGYTGYLTINDMGETRGCHAAIILELAGRKLLVDVGIPLLIALPIDPERVTRRAHWLHTYIVRPDGAGVNSLGMPCPRRYQIERTRHPKRNIYTLYDVPVPEPAYCQVLEQDYTSTGQFLDRVIIVKVREGRLWRFSTADPLNPQGLARLESFGRDGRQEIPIPPDQLASLLSERFQMDAGKIAAALRGVQPAAFNHPPAP